jgi:hypothetical protein
MSIKNVPQGDVQFLLGSFALFFFALSLSRLVVVVDARSLSISLFIYIIISSTMMTDFLFAMMLLLSAGGLLVRFDTDDVLF